MSQERVTKGESMQNRHKMRTLQTRNIHNPSKAWVHEKGVAGRVWSMGGRDIAGKMWSVGGRDIAGKVWSMGGREEYSRE